jgi:hypothetical protein
VKNSMGAAARGPAPTSSSMERLRLRPCRCTEWEAGMGTTVRWEASLFSCRDGVSSFEAAWEAVETRAFAV